MKATKTILTLAAMASPLLLTNCQQPPCEPPVRDYKTVTTASPYVGQYLGKDSIYAVRDREIVKEYVISPYVDPNNPDVRMPGGAMQVMVRPSRWNSEPNQQHGIVVEPQYSRVKDNPSTAYARSQVNLLKAEQEKIKRQLLDTRLETRKIQQLQDQYDAIEAQLKNAQ